MKLPSYQSALSEKRQLDGHRPQFSGALEPARLAFEWPEQLWGLGSGTTEEAKAAAGPAAGRGGGRKVTRKLQLKML